MRSLILGAALLLSTPAPSRAATPAVPPLLPTPASLHETGQGFRLNAAVPLVAADAGTRAAATRLAALMAARGVRLAPASGAARGIAVRFVRRSGIAAEGYSLATGVDGATIAASDDLGFLHGATTLWQLAGAGGMVPGVAIDDAPRFRWRGLMLDSARHYQSPAFIRRLLDAMAASKLNRLHWHLVDDQGWRLPVPGWPRLTHVGGWRRDATAPGAPPLPLEGGVYTPAEIRDIVAYATARGITIVPEIEMPGHALAAIRAYPQLGMGVPVPPGTESDYGVFPWLYNTRPETFTFLEAVLDQVMRLFPDRDIHIGGDEAVKDQWRASPAIQAQIKALGLKDEDALQGWFMGRIATYLARHGRRAIGWDEVLDGGVPADAAITSWRGVAGAVKAAQSGHDAILSPDPALYINNPQGFGPEEPAGRGKLVTLADMLAFDPVPAGLSPEQRRHILGLQANLWTEYVPTDAVAGWMMFPRALAVAEVGWAGPAKRDVAGFAPALVGQIDRLQNLGMPSADSAWAVGVRLDRQADGRIAATLSGQTSLPVRYTLDGSPPSPSSPAYTGPLALAGGTQLRAATFLRDRALPGRYDRIVTEQAALTRTSRELTPCSDAVLLDLEDDWPAKRPRPHYLLDIFHPCWRWSAAPVAAAQRIAIDVGQLPFHFQVGADRAKIRFRPPATPAGEFEVRAGGCDGVPIATLPLAPAVANPGVTRLTASLPRLKDGTTLCISYTARGPDPLWAIDRVELLP